MAFITLLIITVLPGTATMRHSQRSREGLSSSNGPTANMKTATRRLSHTCCTNDGVGAVTGQWSTVELVNYEGRCTQGDDS